MAAVDLENSYQCCQTQRLVGAYGATPEHLHIEMGTPEDCLMETVMEQHTDIMVMGASSMDGGIG